MTRGELCTCYVPLVISAFRRTTFRTALTEAYTEPVRAHCGEGRDPATQHVRGSNYCHIGVFADPSPVARQPPTSTITRSGRRPAKRRFTATMYYLDERTARSSSFHS